MGSRPIWPWIAAAIEMASLLHLWFEDDGSSSEEEGWFTSSSKWSGGNEGKDLSSSVSCGMERRF